MWNMNQSNQAGDVQMENKLGVMPIPKLLVTLSLPLILSMFVQAFYNIVDSFFVARMGEDALAAVSLAFPIQHLMTAVSSGTAVGINAILSRSLGEKDTEKVHQTANNGLLLAFISSFLFVLFGMFFAESFMAHQTSQQQIIDYGYDYLRICCIFSFGAFGQVTLERLLQSTGKTLYTMITQIFGAVINMILDPILIFGLFGFPAMGVAGAAIATVIGQICAMTLAYYFNLTQNHEVTLSWKNFTPDVEIIKAIYKIGVPSILMMSITSVTTLGINKILLSFSSAATAVYGVYYKLQSFALMPTLGLSNGLVPIIAYNLGAKKKERIIEAVKISMIYAAGIMFTGFLICQLFPKQLLWIFNASEEMLRIGVPAIKIISIHFLGTGFCITGVAVYNSTGYSIFSLLLALARQVVVVLPAAYALSLLGNVDRIWWAYVIAEIMALIMTVLFLKYLFKKVIDPIPSEKGFYRTEVTEISIQETVS
jgi:putative MATE family efflux protein